MSDLSVFKADLGRFSRLKIAGTGAIVAGVTIAFGITTVGAASSITALAGTTSTTVASATSEITPTNPWLVPPGTQAGTVNLNEACVVSALGGVVKLNVTADVVITGAMPTTDGPGQPFYISAGQAQVTIPAVLVDGMALFGTTKIEATAPTVNMNLLGATASSVNIAASGPIVIPPTTLTAGQPLTLDLPSGGGTFANIGPVYPASGQSVVDVGLGSVVVDATTLNSSGKPTILGSATVTCAAPSPTVFLGNLSVGGPASTTPNIAPGTYTPATIPVESVEGATAASYTCTFGSLGSFGINLSTSAWGAPSSGTLAGTVGTEFYFQDGQATISIPESLVNAIYGSEGANASEVTQIETTMSKFDLSAVDATPAATNIAAQQSMVGGPSPISDNEPAALHMPGSPGTTLKEFGFTPTAPGQLYVFLQDSAGSIQPMNSSGQPLGSPISFTCPTTYPLTPLLPLTVSPAS